ncbi:hypothetical protein BWD08_10255 [Neisseria animaloris]|nr:hypothetical protein BWD08_10255 [Neisseria animaloris]
MKMDRKNHNMLKAIFENLKSGLKKIVQIKILVSTSNRENTSIFKTENIKQWLRGNKTQPKLNRKPNRKLRKTENNAIKPTASKAANRCYTENKPPCFLPLKNNQCGKKQGGLFCLA